RPHSPASPSAEIIQRQFAGLKKGPRIIDRDKLTTSILTISSDNNEVATSSVPSISNFYRPSRVNLLSQGTEWDAPAPSCCIDSPTAIDPLNIWRVNTRVANARHRVSTTISTRGVQESIG